MPKTDWATEKASDIMTPWSKAHDSVYEDLLLSGCVDLIAQALREAEARGMERAATTLKNREDIFGSRSTENAAIQAIRDAAKAGAHAGD